MNNSINTFTFWEKANPEDVPEHMKSYIELLSKAAKLGIPHKRKYSREELENFIKDNENRD